MLEKRALSSSLWRLEGGDRKRPDVKVDPNRLTKEMYDAGYRGQMGRERSFDQMGYIDKNGNWQWRKEQQGHIKNIGLKFWALFILMCGVSVASEPLYRMFCQSTGRGGQAIVSTLSDKVEEMKVIRERPLRVHFSADKHAQMLWKFQPEQPHVDIFPGETALIFYKAKNPTDKHVIGVSTYTIDPYEVGAYFNKIQCFCFEQQMLGPHEEVDLPVFFFIDPEMDEDPLLSKTFDIGLAYTFFEVKEGQQLPLPGFSHQTSIA